MGGLGTWLAVRSGGRRAWLGGGGEAVPARGARGSREGAAPPPPPCPLPPRGLGNGAARPGLARALGRGRRSGAEEPPPASAAGTGRAGGVPQAGAPNRAQGESLVSGTRAPTGRSSALTPSGPERGPARLRGGTLSPVGRLPPSSAPWYAPGDRCLGIFNIWDAANAEVKWNTSGEGGPGGGSGGGTAAWTRAPCGCGARPGRAGAGARLCGSGGQVRGKRGPRPGGRGISP